ncbi:uncharacterized protein TrAtP1_012952 [Trichoderma atroviride]|uniref:uncharacterized protein n=1 Tax=Hypocrea atroviridis TaxID=63577 RepID=UPI00332A50CC|nr:hypothetical protein TrAtP1_012952 [Trichoderma atroviride]
MLLYPGASPTDGSSSPATSLATAISVLASKPCRIRPDSAPVNSLESPGLPDGFVLGQEVLKQPAGPDGLDLRNPSISGVHISSRLVHSCYRVHNNAIEHSRTPGGTARFPARWSALHNFSHSLKNPG